MKQKQTKKSYKKQKRRSIIPPLLLVLGGLLLVGAVALLLPRGKENPDIQPLVKGAPSLAANQEKIDLGDIRLGEWVSASFQLVNVGDKPLRFERKPYIE